MKANELRIGNYINSKSSKADYWEVLSEDIDKIFNSPDHYFGIPLTEEWFVKFGYKSRHSKFKTGTKIECFPADNGLWFSKRAMDNYWAVMDMEHAISSIEFVHELQNIVFIVDKRELTIKE